MNSVTSPQNPVYKDVLRSLDGSGELIVAHGETIVRDAVKAAQPRTLIFRERWDQSPSASLQELATKRFPEPVTRLVFCDPLFDEIDPFGVPDVIAVFQKPAVKTWSPLDRMSPVPTLILATQNPLNLGACVRSAAAFGIKKIVALKEAANPFHSHSIRSSMGAVFSIEVLKGPSIHSPELNTAEITALDLGGTPIKDFVFPENPILLVGEEGRGIPPSGAWQRVTIPMSRGIDSLNASVSCGIFLYEWSSRKTAIS